VGIKNRFEIFSNKQKEVCLEIMDEEEHKILEEDSSEESNDEEVEGQPQFSSTESENEYCNFY